MILSIGLLALGAALASADAKKAPTIGDFMKIKSPRHGTLAPDGTFYYEFYPDGVFQLYRRAPGAPQAQAERLSDFADGIGSYALSPDGAWVAMTASGGGSEQSDLFLLETATGEMKTLFADPEIRYDTPVWSPDSKMIAFRANTPNPADFSVYVYGVESGESECVVSAPGFFWASNFSPDGSRVVVGKYNSSSDMPLFEVDVASKQMRQMTPAGDEAFFEPIGYGADGARFIVMSSYGGDRMRMQSVDLASGKVTPLDDGSSEHEVEGAAISTDRTALAVLHNEDGYQHLSLFSLPEYGRLKGPNLPKGIVNDVRFTGRKLVCSLSNARAPGIIYSWSLDAPDEEPVAISRAELHGVDVSRFTLPELIEYESFDGRKIPAFLFLPPDYEPGSPIPFLIHFHGGPADQFRPEFVRNFQYFVSRGFGVLAPNVRGSSGYGKQYMEMDDYRGRIASVKDGIAAAEWLIARGYARKGKIGAYGTSYGGYMTTAVIAEAPDLWGAACSRAGIVNFETFLENTKEYRQSLREAEYGPLSDPEFLRSISPIHKAGRITAPLMLVHGLNDPRVPIGEALQIALSLKQRGVAVEQLYFPDEGHTIAKEDNRVLYYEGLARFFEEHLRN